MINLLVIGFDLGFSRETLRARKRWLDIAEFMDVQALPELPPKKKFSPKHALPVLADYGKEAPQDFWDKFPTNYVCPKKSLVDWKLLLKLGIETNYPDKEELKKVANWLQNGATIGCEGTFRLPSYSNNTKGAILEGHKVTDAICDWVVKGFALGPVKREDVPEHAKINSIMTKEKPNGSVRVILNLSAPTGNSVNDGIDATQFPTSMSSTVDWIRILNKAGRGCLMNKLDWADAYKHVGVSPDDTDLQWFYWLGRYFKELSLVFGGASSAGIFNPVNKIVIHIVTKMSGFSGENVIQHLDDCCAAAPKNSKSLQKFDQTFQDIASKLGIKLAPRSDLEKSFAPCTSGVVLGILYDTENWTWGLTEEKMSRLLHIISDVIKAEKITQREVWSLVGKIINIKPLIPGGNFHMHYLMEANCYSTDGAAEVPITDGLRSQLQFWLKILPICSGRIKIPDPDEHMAPWTIQVYTDAAGGSWNNPYWHGVGSVTYGWWTFMPWSKKINAGIDNGYGKRLDCSMAFLELLGPLITVASGYNWCRNNSILVWVDNSASVAIFKKGYSVSCKLSSTVVRATVTVAAGIKCKIDVKKITRCSTAFAELADLLSKGRFQKFWGKSKEIPNIDLPLDMARIPSSILKWLRDPVVDDNLGGKILEEISEFTDVLGY